MRPIIFPYKFGSQSARALSEELRRRGHRAKRVRGDGNYRPSRNHLIINWGNSTQPTTWGYYEDRVLNMCGPVSRASNKLDAFGIMQGPTGVTIPDFTTDREEAQQWVDDGNVVVCRSILRGHSGAGIGLVGQQIEDGDHTGTVPPNIPLYVKYIKKAREYRVHVFQGRIIDVQQKRKRGGIDSEEVDYQVRNHSNGWVYCRGDVAPNQSVLDNAIAATRALGLDFGGVDVIWNDHYEQATVLECNTAVGLEGATVNIYADAIEQLL